jgi:nucleoside recognition membrane protein YjiH
MATIYYFQVNAIPWSTLSIMALAMFNGIISSIILETIILLKQMKLMPALKTAFGMSLISMISMELAMNIVDVLFTGGAKINLYVIPLMLVAGFLTPWLYNYWRLKKFGVGCCG